MRYTSTGGRAIFRFYFSELEAIRQWRGRTLLHLGLAGSGFDYERNSYLSGFGGYIRKAHSSWIARRN